MAEGLDLTIGETVISLDFKTRGPIVAKLGSERGDLFGVLTTNGRVDWWLGRSLNRVDD